MAPMAARLSIVLAGWLAVSLAGCRTQTYEGLGDLVAVDAQGATIAHERIPGLMDAMTMRFPARPPSILDGAQPGTRVSFRVVREGDALVLVELNPLGMARGTTPGSHDHRPRFGGVVSMIGMIHVEIAASPDGRVRAYLSDLWRRPLAAKGVAGTARLQLSEGTRTLTFSEVGEALEARTQPFSADTTLASVALIRQGQPLEMNVLLDLTGNRAGVPIIPQTGCVAPGREAARGRAPRCVVTFAQTFTALGSTPDGARAIVTTAHGATTVWGLPEGTLVMGVDPAPPIPVLPGAHEPDPRAVVVRPDGTEIVMAIGDRLAFFAAATGRFRRVFTVPFGPIRAVAWSSDGARLLVASAGDGTVRVVQASDGQIVRTASADVPAFLMALDGTDRWAAIGSDVGTVALLDLVADVAPRVLTPSLQPISSVAFVADRLVTVGTDGTLRMFAPASGHETAKVRVGTPLVLLAIAPDGRHAATADREHTLRIHRLPDGVVIEELAWHRASVNVLAWGAGATLVSGDTDGELAVWDVPDAR